MSGVKIVEDAFGVVQVPNSERTVPVRRFTFSNTSNGVAVQVITYGATITSIVVPDNKGQCDDVVLGFDDIEGYHRADNPYFGATIGRVCNRIADGKFQLNGKQFTLIKNIPGVHLHGGVVGFDKYNWDAELVGTDTVVMSHLNADGAEGYPGTVLASVTYRLSAANEFSVQFQATASKSTPINLTNHSYFNLAGHAAGSPELYKHTVTVNADRITETDALSVPSGVLRSVAGTPFDLREPRELGAAMAALSGSGFDDNYCVSPVQNPTPVQLVAAVSHRGSGRSLEVYSDQPGVQFYTANYLPDPLNEIYPDGKVQMASAPNAAPYGVAGKNGRDYYKHGAFCLETQKYPDAVNHPNFPSTIVHPGDIYRHRVVYKFCSDVTEIVLM